MVYIEFLTVIFSSCERTSVMSLPSETVFVVYNYNYELSLKRKDPVMNTLTIPIKIMKFCAPDYPQRFHWSHMMPDKLNLMTLNNDMELKPNTIANFFEDLEDHGEGGPV